ncbi:hypothetical protein ACHAPO_011177 [Fusarium lateritium]
MSAGQRKIALDSMVKGMCNARDSNKESGFTLGWDVVVSYTEDEINALLKNKWDKDRTRMVTEIVSKSDVFDEDDGEEIRVVRKLFLDAPLIRFHSGEGGEPSVELTMPVMSGWRQQEDMQTGKPKGVQSEMPTNAFNIKLSGIRLGTVVGKYEEIKNTANQDATKLSIVNSKETCVFRQNLSKPTTDDFEVAWVVLDLATEGEKYTVTGEITLSPNDPNYKKAKGLLNNVVGSAKDYFENGDKIDVLRYALATVKNKPQFDGAISVDLTPVSFRLATFSASYTAQRALSLLIHTQSGRDAGEKADLQTKWKGQWVDNGIAPIPDGHTASLMFNPELTFKTMIEPGLERSKAWDVDDERLKDREGGLAFNARKTRDWYVASGSFDYEDTVNFCTLYVRGWQKNFKNDPAAIHIHQKNYDGPPVANINWKFNIESEWTDLTKDGKWYALGKKVEYKSVNVRTTYSLNDDVDLIVKTTDTDVSFSIDASKVTEKWQLSDEKIDHKGDWFDRATTAINNFVSANPTESALNKRREWMGSLKPSIEFDVVGLGFFMTTNLLNPGAKVIKLDQAVGLRLPKDLLLVGDVIQGQDAVKAR